MPEHDAIKVEAEAATLAVMRAPVGRHLWIVRRLAFGILTLWLVSVLVFAATQALPSDPARVILGRDATPESLAAVRHALGLDHSLVRQYTDWLGGVFTGSLGDSLVAHVSVGSLISSRIVNSLLLVLFTSAISIPAAVLLGAFAAIRRDRNFDKTVLLLSFGLTALPEFVIGMALVILFATSVLTVLPAVALIPPGESAFSHLKLFILPVATLVLAVVPYLYRLVRGSMIDVLESDYIQMARLKGMPERIVMLRHALPNALVPAIQGSALVVAYLLGGVVVVEFLFGFPGLGSALTDGVANRDVPVVQAVTLIFAAGVVLVNLLADVLTVYVTPRLRTAGG